MTPWLGMWIHPRATVRERMERGGHGYLLAVLLSGFLAGLNRSVALAGGHWPALGPALRAGGLGMAAAITAFFLVAVFLAATCRHLGGRASLREFCTGLGWAYAPAAAWQVMVLGWTLWGDPTGLPVVLLLVPMAIGLWMLVILLEALAEVLGVSAWIALLQLLLATLILAVMAFVLVVFYVTGRLILLG